jgi:TonB-linked SusC/RagA family outer membrane protein
MYHFYKYDTPTRVCIVKSLIIMKLSFLLLIIPLLPASASSYAQGITLSKQNATLSEIFTELRKQTDYTFVYSNTQISNAKKISISVKDVQITDVLDRCFEDQALTYSISNYIITIKDKPQSFINRILKHFSAVIISGTVSDEQGIPLPGATVKLQGSRTTTRTDDKGFFSLNSDEESGVLNISYLGYVSERISFFPNNVGPFKVILKQESSGLEEVEINAGYYTVKDKERTGSISRVTAETINKQPVSNVLGALIGRMAGVNIEQQSGINGGGYKVEIRGINSLRADGREPLYLVDGVPYPSTRLTEINLGVSSINIGNGASPLNYLAPSDIESIEILKDADATAIYGSRGANGVVLITTKRGKTGKTSANINLNSGISKVGKKLDLLNTKEYLEMRKEAFANDGVIFKSTDYDINGTWDQNSFTDWQDVLIGGTAHSTNIQAGLNGGNEFTQFAFRGNYSRQTTVFPGDFADRKGSGSMTVNHISPNNRFKANFNAIYSTDNNNVPQIDLTSYITLAPNAPSLYDTQGNLNWALNSAGSSTWTNPLSTLRNRYTGASSDLISSATLEYKIWKSLFLKTNLGYTNIRLRENLINPISAQVPSSSAAGIHQIASNVMESYIIEPQISYEQVTGFGTLNILVGGTFQKDDQKKETLAGIGYTSDLLINNITAAPNKGGSSSDSQYKYNALFGRINYNIDSKYILNLTGRRDGSSRFGPGNQFANFGAAGVAWLFSKEALFKQWLPQISFGKIRGSYGITGSDQIPNYGYLDTYMAAQSYLDGSSINPSRLANSDYSWETNKKLEISLDLGFLNDKIFLSSSWYRNRSSNQLVGYPLPDLAGFPSVQYNLPATVENSGWEFELNTTNITSKNFSWKTNLNMSRPTNKLLSYPNLAGSGYFGIYTIGASLYQPFGYHYLGVNPSTGVYTFEDLNKNGNDTDAADKKVSEKALTSTLFGGIQNSLSFKSFQLDFLFQFAKKNVRNATSLFTTPGALGNQPTVVLRRWQKVGDETDIQKFSQITGTGTARQRFGYTLQSDKFDDASFIRLKNVSISWSAPSSFIQKLKLNSLKFYIQGQNLFTITKYLGDPEIPSFKTLPALTQVVAGIQLSL